METIANRAEIIKLLKTVSEEQGINKYVISDVKTNQKGEGYLGEIFMVTIKDVNSDKHLEVVIKAAFNQEKVREMVPIRMSFENEIYFYKSIHPTFEEFEKGHELQNLKIVPQCFKVSAKEQEELLVLENLKVSGFEIFDKTNILDEDHVRLIFKTYGKFHGYSFALRDQRPEEYAKVSKKIHNVYTAFMKSEFFPQHLMEINKLVQNCFTSEDDYDIKKKYEKYSGENIVNIFNDVLTEDVEESAILHGDCWSNNMMFKYDKDPINGRKPIDMRLIDWQLIKVGSPVCDLSYCLYSGASKEIFDNLDDYLKVYYDSFSSFVRQLGSDPAKLFPFSTLKEHWKKYSKFGMIMAFFVLKMKLTHKEDMISLNEGYDVDELHEVLQKQKFDHESYHKRILGILQHMSDVNAL